MIKVKKKIKINKKIIFGLLILFSMFAVFASYYNMKFGNIDESLIGNNKTYFIVYSVIAAVISIIAMFVIKDSEDKNIHKKYLLCALILGIGYVFIVPLFAQSDEPAHYLRAYDISNGNVLTKEGIGNFDKSIYDSIHIREGEIALKSYQDMDTIKNYSKNTEQVEHEIRASGYNPVNYIPHIIGISIGKIFNANPYVCGILGRIFSLIFCVLLVTFGIKKLPKGKFFAAMIFLSPVALSYMSAFSADGTLFAYAFVLISYVLYIRENKIKVNWKNTSILLLFSILLSLSKTIYVPIVFVLFLLPNESFKNKKWSWMFKLSLLLLAIVIDYLYMKYPFVSAAESSSIVSSIETTTNGWLLHNPFKYLLVIVNNMIENGYSQITNMFYGGFLCHGQIKATQIVQFAFVLVYFLSYFSEEKDYKISKYTKIFFGLVAFGIYVLISTSMYIYNTKEHALLINGVQGRYLFPIMLLLLLGTVKKHNINKNILALANVFLTFMAFLTIIMTFTF